MKKWNFVWNTIANSCKTTEGLDCIFPFIHEGNSYCGCKPGFIPFLTPDECATNVDDRGISTEFGDCGPNCILGSRKY